MFSNKVIRVIKLSPMRIIRNVAQKINNYFRYNKEKQLIKSGKNTISDKDFLDSLTECFSDSNRAVSMIISRGEEHLHLFGDCEGFKAQILRKYCPDQEKLVISRANQICNHEFDLLGSGPFCFNEKIDWHLDFISGYSFPKIFYCHDIKPAAYPGEYDIKVPWELSRFQHLAWLGEAYTLTKNEKYACEFVMEIEDWIENNPINQGCNWTCTMDVAIRVANWLYAYSLFHDSLILTPDFHLLFLKSLLAHGRYISNNLEFDEPNRNHYLANLVGLLILGLFCPYFKESTKWYKYAFKELENEMERQVNSEGVHFESSTSYHCLVTEFFLFSSILSAYYGFQFSFNYLRKLEAMLEYIHNITRGDGSIPIIGDIDNGKLFRLKVWRESDQEWGDVRHLLAIGGMFFDRKDFLCTAEGCIEEAIWFFGPQVEKHFHQNKDIHRMIESIEYSKSGVYLLKHEDVSMFINTGRLRQDGLLGHVHNDLLSFELFSNGKAWVVDPGTFVYTSNYEARNIFRSVKMHNTVSVGDQEQNPIEASLPFAMQNRAKCQIVKWYSDKFMDVLIAEYTNYQPFGKSVVIQREYIFNKETREIRIIDLLKSDANAEVIGNIILGSDVQVEINNHRLCLLYEQGKKSMIIDFDKVEHLDIEPIEISPSYGCKIKSQKIVYHFKIQASFTLIL
jgi:uncharacterized heparinase superfamily protein